MIASAENSARGTVRAGSRTSPLGTRATSRPTNAKIRTIAVRPIAAPVGIPGQRRYAGVTNQMPPPTSTSSGSSFAAVTISTRRTPGVTPRTLTPARIANSAAIKIARAGGDAAAGASAPTDPA